MLNERTDSQRYLQSALWLGYFTIFYNLLEGLVSIFFGARGGALTLFGFGVDSFIEVLSGLGILAMIFRIRQNPDSPSTPFEVNALRITGTSLYLFSAGMLVTALYNSLSGHKPETSLPGILISLVSIFIMGALVAGKRKVGRLLRSEPILADAECSLVCVYMSLVLLASSLIYKLTGFGLVDSIGALGLIYFAFHEGRESFEKAKAMQNNPDSPIIDGKNLDRKGEKLP